MLNRQLILERLSMLRSSVNRLNKLKNLSANAFLSDPDNYAIAEHHLRRALECVLDVGRHIVVKKGLIKTKLDDFARFAGYILEYLEREN